MTKKRYFKKEWEEEYYIFDSTHISEEKVDEESEYTYNVFADSMQGDEVVNRLNKQEETIQKYKHLVKIATNLIEWNTIPQIRREWQKHLSKVGDVE